MNQLALSIIVPVYNVEAYLEACVASLMAQDMSQAEVILVDDGSTDDSGVLCDELVKRYTCIRCIHKANEGVSAARNDGMNAARGKYILFVDSDDLIAPQGIDAVLNWVQENHADICFLQVHKLYPDGTLKDQGDCITYTGICGKNKTAVMRYLASRPKYPGSACAKVFRRDFLREEQLLFIKGRKHGEDLSFMMACLLAAQSYDALDVPFYQYRQARAGSATYHSANRSYSQLCLFVVEWAERLTHDRRANNVISAYAMSFVAYEYAILLWRRGDLTGSDLAYVDDFLRKNGWVMRYARNFKIRGICIARKILGVKTTAKVLEMAKKL